MPDTDLFLKLSEKQDRKRRQGVDLKSPNVPRGDLDKPSVSTPKKKPLLGTPQKSRTPTKERVSFTDNKTGRAQQRVEERKFTSQEVSEESRKFTSKLVNILGDPPVNKVGYYFTKREIDQLDALMTKLKPILRDRFNLKVTKNDVIRGCLAIGFADWEENQLTSKLVTLLTRK